MFTAFLAVPVFADDDKVCTIGDIPNNRFPLGTSLVYSACFDGCRAENGWQTNSGFEYVWTCGANGTDYCTGYFTTTGESCTGQEDTDGSCDASGDCSPVDNGDGSGDGSDDGGPDGSINKGTVCVSSGCYDFNVDLSWIADDFDVTKGLLRSLSSTEQIHFEALKSGQLTIRDTVMNNTSLVTTMRGEVSSLTKDVEKISDSITNFDVDLSELDPKFAEIQSTLSEHVSTSTSQFYRLMDYVAPINGLFGGVNGNIQTLSGTVSGLRSELNNHLTYNDSLVTKNGQDIAQLSNSLSTLSGDVSGIADGLEALSSQISGAGGTGGDVDLSGVESKLQGIQETLDGKGMVGRPFEGQVDFEANGLYGTDAIENLEGEIEQLETKYQEQMEQFKSLFTFDESELADGTYVEHKWTFRFANGHVNSFSSGVFPALLENSSLIAAVLLFLAVLLGIKALTD
ncbi:hypothetical protein [Vibrio furnissii]|uniref:hypothetical protein n=1 Tax=Vibrio furnissii TaxID=29494 RepID=UPI001EEBEA2D|nr:hypothetical protein [Vibrio furnissii]MCG6216063.1 hypothetical protein [Vibrio furnissii]